MGLSLSSALSHGSRHVPRGGDGMSAEPVLTSNLWRIAATALSLMLALPATAQRDPMPGLEISSMSGMQMPAPKPKKPKMQKKRRAVPTQLNPAQGMGGMDMSSEHGKQMSSPQPAKPHPTPAVPAAASSGTRSMKGMNMSSKPGMTM